MRLVFVGGEVKDRRFLIMPSSDREVFLTAAVPITTNIFEVTVSGIYQIGALILLAYTAIRVQLLLTFCTRGSTGAPTMRNVLG